MCFSSLQAFKSTHPPQHPEPSQPNQPPIYNELDPPSQGHVHRPRSRGSEQGRGSRRSYDSDRKPASQEKGHNSLSPRRQKNSFYDDNQDVMAKRNQANRARALEYNEFLKHKVCMHRTWKKTVNKNVIAQPFSFHSFYFDPEWTVFPKLQALFYLECTFYYEWCVLFYSTLMIKIHIFFTLIFLKGAFYIFKGGIVWLWYQVYLSHLKHK